MAFTYTTAIEKMRAMKARKKVVQGGTSSGKTYGIIPILIDTATRNPRIRITVVAESIPAVKDGAVKIFKDVMQDTGRWVEDRWIANPMEYTFANKTVIQFKSFDTVGKAKAAGKREVLFLNEANHIPYEIADALMIRSKETWIDFNPDDEFWAHTEVLQEPNSEFLLLTYHDNEALPPETLEDLMIKLDKAFRDPNKSWSDPANIKSGYWANWCKVYIAGEIGSLQGTVFQFEQVPAVPLEAELIGIGLDWGFYPDAAGCTALYKCDGDLYWEEILYEHNLTNAQLSDKLLAKGLNKRTGLIADSAEPKSIQEFCDLGWMMEAAQKGPDSVRHSIDTLQNYKHKVVSTSTNLIKELRNYRWETDASGKPTGKPVDKYNHLIDPVRYIALNRIGETTGQYSVL